MENELKSSNQQAYREADNKEAVQVPSLETAVKELASKGGYDFLEAVVDGVDSMNPARKAKRNIFLTDPDKKASVATSRRS
nr:hypothetical protein [Paraflavitalea speifideiaquila]